MVVGIGGLGVWKVRLQGLDLGLWCWGVRVKK